MELDRDGNGSISLEELQGGLGDRENAESLLQIIMAADTDGNGVINYTGKYIEYDSVKYMTYSALLVRT